jgi:hypothetical protein
MSKLLEKAIEEARRLSEVDQDIAAVEIMRIVAAADDLQLTDEQVKEVQRRLKEKNPKTLTMGQLDARLKRLGV